jgi:hypothetical protein
LYPSKFHIVRCDKGKILEFCMWKAALTGAVALVTIGSLSFSGQGVTFNSAAAQDVLLHESDIARLKTALKLTAAQEVHWRPVEVSLNAYARHQYQLASSDNSFSEWGDGGMSEFTISAVMLQRVKRAAEPLIKTLSEEQKSAGMAVLQSMGLHF